MASRPKKAAVAASLVDADRVLADLSGLAPRFVAFDTHLPARAAPVRRAMAVAVFDEAQAIALDLQASLRALGARSRLATVELDFALPDYDEFVRRERRVEKALAKLPDSLFAFGSEGAVAVRARAGAPAREREGGEGEQEQPQDNTRKWVAKIFAAFGVGELFQAVLELLEEDGIMRLIAGAIRGRDWSSLKTFLKMLGDLLTSRPFFRKLAQKIGENAAAKLVGKILGKCLPFVGWALLIGGIVWAVVEQFL